MTVVYHVLVGAAIAHVAAAQLSRPDGTVRKPSGLMISCVGALGVLSHGILDGLKHGYPLGALAAVILGALLAIAWVLAVRPSLALLFAVAIAGALAPDVIDLGPDILRRVLDVHVPWAALGHVFPWHWSAGSGSMYPGDPMPSRDLRAPHHQVVSYVNHAIVVTFSVASISTSPWAFRWKPIRGAAQQ